jgi:phosphoesterase RecJ-like protein
MEYRMSDVPTELLTLVRGSARVLLTGPEGPDGDSIGACLGLRRLLATVAPDVRVDVAGTPGFRYDWVPDAVAMVPDGRVRPEYDGVVVMDGDRTRLPREVAAAFAAARWRGIVDHHRSTDTAGYDVALFDPAAESTCTMVAGLARVWGVPLEHDLATLLYVGLIFDTGGFRHSNTTPATHRLAAELMEHDIGAHLLHLRVLHERRLAGTRLVGRLLAEARVIADGRVLLAVCTRALMDELGAQHADLEGVVELLQQTRGVQVSGVLTERSGTQCKVSLRSAGGVDVAALAKRLDAGGGGHAKAAGVTLPWGLEEALVRVERELARSAA